MMIRELAEIKIKYIIFISTLFISLYSCNSKLNKYRQIRYDANSLCWKEYCIEFLDKIYPNYSKNMMPKCFDKDNIEMEKYHLKHLIFKINFEDHFVTQENWAKNKNLLYDSIYFTNSFIAGFVNRDFPTLNTRWYYFKNDVIIDSIGTSEQDNKFETFRISDNLPTLFSQLKSENGCAESIIIVSKYNKNHVRLAERIDIVHMALNAENAY